MLRKVWALGPAGVEVPLVVVREERPVAVTVRSADRNAYLKQPPLH